MNNPSGLSNSKLETWMRVMMSSALLRRGYKDRSGSKPVVRRHVRRAKNRHARRARARNRR